MDSESHSSAWPGSDFVECPVRSVFVQVTVVPEVILSTEGTIFPVVTIFTAVSPLAARPSGALIGWSSVPNSAISVASAAVTNSPLGNSLMS